MEGQNIFSWRPRLSALALVLTVVLVLAATALVAQASSLWSAKSSSVTAMDNRSGGRGSQDEGGSSRYDPWRFAAMHHWVRVGPDRYAYLRFKDRSAYDKYQWRLSRPTLRELEAKKSEDGHH